MRKIVPFALCAATAFTLVSCTASTTPVFDQDGESSPAQVQFPELSWSSDTGSEGITGTRVRLEDAVVVDIDELLTLEYSTQTFNTKKQSFMPLDISADGVLFGAVHPTAQQMKEKSFDGSKVVIQSVAATVDSGKLAKFPGAQKTLSSDGPRQITAGASLDGQFVWSETASTAGGDTSWRVFTGGKNQEPELLGRAEDFISEADGSVIPSGQQMALKGSTAYWDSVKNIDGSDFVPGILSSELDDTKQAREFLGYSQHPVALDSWVATIGMEQLEDSVGLRRQINLQNFAKDGTGRSLALLREEGEGNEVATSFADLAGSGSTLMTAYAENLLILDVEGSLVAAVENPSERDPEGMAVCGNYATWTYSNDEEAGDSAQFFLNLDTKGLLRVANEDLFGETFCAGEYFAWSLMPLGDSEATSYAEVFKWIEPKS